MWGCGPFTDEETDVHRGHVACPSSHASVGWSDLEHGQPTAPLRLALLRLPRAAAATVFKNPFVYSVSLYLIFGDKVLFFMSKLNTLSVLLIFSFV